MSTRVNAVASLDVIVEPANDTPAAIQSAELFKRALADVPDVTTIIRDMMHGIFCGRSVHEHIWRRRGTYSYSIPEWVDPRNTRFDSNWDYQVMKADREWIGLPEGKYMIHAPKERATAPTKTALLRSVAWLWLFKFWAWTFWIAGAERTANPYVTGKVPPGADKDIKAQLLDDLEKLSADHASVHDDNTEIVIHNMDFGGSSDVWDKLITRANEGMTKLILGSTTNTEIGDTGGAYAAALSQAVVTIEPRIEVDALAISQTLRDQWAEPHLQENAHLITGDPVLPNIRLAGQDKHEDIPVHIFAALRESRALTVNQTLTMAGLPPVADGDRALEPAAPAAPPMFSASPEPGGAPTPDPFSRALQTSSRPSSRKGVRPKSQQSLPWTSRTPSASLSPIGHVPPPKSGDPSS